MTYVRAALKAIGFCGLTGGIYAVWLAGLPFAGTSAGARWRWRNFIFRRWATLTARLLCVRVDVSGEPPAPPFLLVANHLGYVDVVVLAGLTGAVFVAKSEVARWPALGAMCRGMRTIFVDRASRRDAARVNDLIGRALGAGQGVVLFPEGTSTRGAGVLPFKPALLDVAARSGHPVSFAAISYRTRPGERAAQESVCWWGAMTFLPHFWGLLQLSEVRAAVSFGAHAVRADDRKALAGELWRAVRANFTPLTAAENECELTRH